MAEENMNDEELENMDLEGIDPDDLPEDEISQEDEEADFNAGFGEEEDEYEPVVEPEEEKEEEKAEPEQEKEEEKDDKFEELRRVKEENLSLNDRLRKLEGRYGELNAKIKASEEAKKLDRGPGFPTKDQVMAAKTPDELESLKEQYPLWADEVEEREALMQARLGVDDFVTKEDLAAMARADALQGYVSKEEISAIIGRERERILLDVTYPEWKQTVRSEGFQGWLQKQDASAIELYKSDSSADAIKLLSSYVKHTDDERKAQERQGRLEDAVPATRGGRNSTTKVTSEQEEFEAAFKGRT